MAGARTHRAENGAFARPTKGGALRTRIALATAVIVALEITTAMSITAGGALVLSGATSDGAHDSTGSSTTESTSVASALVSLRTLGTETVVHRAPATADGGGTPVPPTGVSAGTSPAPRSSAVAANHVGNDQPPPTSVPRNATTSTSTIPVPTTATTAAGPAAAATTGTTGTTGTTAQAIATASSDSDATSTGTSGLVLHQKRGVRRRLQQSLGATGRLRHPRFDLAVSGLQRVSVRGVFLRAGCGGLAAVPPVRLAAVGHPLHLRPGLTPHGSPALP